MTVKIPPEQFAKVAKVDFYLGTFAVLAAVGYLAFLLSNSPRTDATSATKPAASSTSTRRRVRWCDNARSATAGR